MPGTDTGLDHGMYSYPGMGLADADTWQVVIRRYVVIYCLYRYPGLYGTGRWRYSGLDITGTDTLPVLLSWPGSGMYCYPGMCWYPGLGLAGTDILPLAGRSWGPDRCWHPGLGLAGTDKLALAWQDLMSWQVLSWSEQVVIFWPGSHRYCLQFESAQFWYTLTTGKILIVIVHFYMKINAQIYHIYPRAGMDLTN